MVVEQFFVAGLASKPNTAMIMQALQHIRGVQHVQINLSIRTIRIVHDGNVQPHTLVSALYEIGYKHVAMLA